jgi:hypothetical protein
MKEKPIYGISNMQLHVIFDYLKKKNLLCSEKCEFCDFAKKEVGGFYLKRAKVAFYCGSPSCRALAYLEIMKQNGNGSPILENTERVV